MILKCISRKGFVIFRDRQTDRQTDRQRDRQTNSCL